ncbi:MAG: hypothetical protein ACLFOY_04015 [Desulfatibacillaceae bacterium]
MVASHHHPPYIWGGELFKLLIMVKFSTKAKQVISNKLGIPFDELQEWSAEELDRHIENNVIHKRLRVMEVAKQLVPGRGNVLDHIDMADIDRDIDSFIDE